MTLSAQFLQGKYEVLEKIREGGMGAIYKARHLLLDDVRIIKVMRPHIAQDEELSRRFESEAKLAIRVRHPNIAQLLDYSVDDDGTALIVNDNDGMHDNNGETQLLRLPKIFSAPEDH